MADKPSSIAARRAVKAGDCRAWTPADALRDALAEIEAGTLKPEMLYIAVLATDPDKPRRPVLRFFAAGGSKTELAGLLTRHLHKHCRED